MFLLYNSGVDISVCLGSIKAVPNCLRLTWRALLMGMHLNCKMSGFKLAAKASCDTKMCEVAHVINLSISEIIVARAASLSDTEIIEKRLLKCFEVTCIPTSCQKKLHRLPRNTSETRMLSLYLSIRNQLNRVQRIYEKLY